MQAWPSNLHLIGAELALRVVERKEYFFVPPNLTEPKKPVIFEPNSGDINHGIQRNKQPLVSVWDAIVPMIVVRKRRKLFFKKISCYRLSAHKIQGLNLVNPLGIPVCMVLDEIHDDFFGKLHYGVQGLYYDKKQHKNLKSSFILIREKILDTAEDCNPKIGDNILSFAKVLIGKIKKNF